MAVTLGGVMTALVGFTYTDEDDPDSPYRCASAMCCRSCTCPEYNIHTRLIALLVRSITPRHGLATLRPPNRCTSRTVIMPVLVPHAKRSCLRRLSAGPVSPPEDRRASRLLYRTGVHAAGLCRASWGAYIASAQRIVGGRTSG